MDKLLQALDGRSADDALVNRFLSVWPAIEAIFNAFSTTTGLPTFVFLNRKKIFQSPSDTLPLFCRLMLSEENTEKLCIEDGIKRAERIEPELANGIQCCHAGRLSARCDIDTGCVGIMTILYGARHSTEPIALERRRSVIQLVKRDSPVLGEHLQQVSETQRTATMYDTDLHLMDAIAEIVHRLFRATVDIHSLTINLAHELSVTMLGLGLVADEINTIGGHLKKLIESGRLPSEPMFDEMHALQSHLVTEFRLALYTIRNFLSHASETKYSQVTKPQFVSVNLRSVLLDMVDLYERVAMLKGITFDLSNLPELPRIRGVEMEIRRALHNILNNALKYSYHSIPAQQRTIRIRANVPYDPGFKERRFSIAFENYGLGVTEDEKRHVFQAGFRGQQAITEVPIGSGIGLSEASKIMRVHGAEIKLNSKKLHDG